jgi:DNA-binding CsgD family transcriptional regulator
MKSDHQQHKRHAEVIDLYQRGFSKSLIADYLNISESTVYWHIKREKARLAQSFAAPIDDAVPKGEIVQ